MTGLNGVREYLQKTDPCPGARRRAKRPASMRGPLRTQQLSWISLGVSLAGLACTIQTEENFPGAESTDPTTSSSDGSASGTADETGEGSSSEGSAPEGSTSEGSTSTSDAETTSSGSTANATTTGDSADCGNGIIDGAEACDTNDLGGLTCTDFGFMDGSLTCGVNCQISTDECSICGDDKVTGTEPCDGTNLGGGTCNSQGFDGGTIACNATCSGFDTTQCTACGDGTIDMGEICEGDVGEETCESQGFDGGNLSCGADCQYDTSACHSCGDGMIGGPEECDDADLGGASCLDFPAPQNGNFTGGELACTDACVFDTSACTYCGDGTRNGAEVCEGDDLGEAVCFDAGWLGGGTLTCNEDCTYDDSECLGPMCGDSESPPAADSGTCMSPFPENGDVCKRTCNASFECDKESMACPPDRNCELDCTGYQGCMGSEITCPTGGACDITCGPGAFACNGTTIYCPPDAPCTIFCESYQACGRATIHCPTGNHACEIVCSGTLACSSVKLQCGDGPCSMDCQNHYGSCQSASVACGMNACEATCAGQASMFPPTMQCDPSCGCQTC